MAETLYKLCTELKDLLYVAPSGTPGFDDEWEARRRELLPRASAALAAEPAPVVGAPTDEELEDFAWQHGGGYFNCDCQEEADILTRKHVAFARAVLARFGTAPPPAAPVLCPACEGSPAPGNTPCAVCGTATALPLPEVSP